jgi:hypothetical protein
MTQLVKNGQLDESRASITASSVKKIVFKGDREWEVVFINKKSLIQPSK